MKDRIGIAVIALAGILISCFFVTGSVPAPGYITVDSRSEVMQPTFCMYLDRCFRHHQVQLDIGTITVSKVRRSSEEKNGWEFDSPSKWGEGQTVWSLEYKSSDNFIKKLLGLSTSPVSCLTYGEEPPGYEEDVKAKPLEPGEFYSVWMKEHNYPRYAEGLRFIIRLDGTGVPDRLEYHIDDFRITHQRYFTSPRDDLKLYY